jgi:Rrf2 family protein
MMISTKGRYALRVMADMAEHNTGEFIPLKEITDRQGISLKYLESIMSILSKGHLVESASGKGGGYRLIKTPEQYRVGDILRLTEGSLAPVACLCTDTKKCDVTQDCYTLPFWQGLGDTINQYLDSHTLADLITQGKGTSCN